MMIEERNHRELCLGHFRELRTFDMECDKCKPDERNKECPHYRPVNVYELVFIKGGKKHEEER